MSDRGVNEAMRLHINFPPIKLKLRSGNCNEVQQEESEMSINDINSLAHTKVTFTRDYTG